MKKILITGGAGYIGSHTCKLLKQQGYEPVTFDNLCNGHEHAVKWGPFIYGDLRDVDAVDAAFKTHDFSAVIHFASLIEVGESVKDPEKYYDNNVLGAMNLLKAMHANDVSRIVFSSSCAVYGTPDQVPIDEETPMAPINPYGQTKMMIEQMLQVDQQAYGLKYVACRYFNACGADPDLEVGEEHNPETHIIPLALAAAAGDREGFNIYGDDYDTPDGTCIRDYIHVCDLARAHIAALKYLENCGESTSINLGTGDGYSVRQIVDAVTKITKKQIPVKVTPRREGDPAVLTAKTQKSKDILGFSPSSSDLETIISSAWAFYNGKKAA